MGFPSSLGNQICNADGCHHNFFETVSHCTVRETLVEKTEAFVVTFDQLVYVSLDLDCNADGQLRLGYDGVRQSYSCQRANFRSVGLACEHVVRVDRCHCDGVPLSIIELVLCFEDAPLLIESEKVSLGVGNSLDKEIDWFWVDEDAACVTIRITVRDVAF